MKKNREKEEKKCKTTGKMDGIAVTTTTPERRGGPASYREVSRLHKK